MRQPRREQPFAGDHQKVGKYAQRGDPYATHVKRTTKLLVPKLNWPRGQWTQTFQSQFGKDEWLKP